MTAEIAVMNKQAIALAADSAVTIGGRQKTYNSANKLFMLSKYEPVGAMIYGGAEFLGIPWETILKCYRDELGTRTFDHLGEYAEDVLKFLHTNEELFTADRKETHLASVFKGLFSEIVYIIDEAVFKKSSGSEEIPEISLAEIICSTIRDFKGKLQEPTSLENCQQPPPEDLVRKISQQAMKRVFEQLPLTEGNIEDLLWLARQWINRDIWGSSHSGLVIAGFGRKDIFPSLQDFKLELALGTFLKYKREEPHAISDENNACVAAFAQREMVDAFMLGADPRYVRMAEGHLDTLFQGISGKIVDNLVKSGRIQKEGRGDVIRDLKNGVDILLTKFKSELKDYQYATFVQETIGIVSVLPKGELGEMAETLVSLTSFKRRMSLDAETVGGPIDVAVISKGDGFIWVKRKHYFKSDLNHGFFKNYYRQGK